MLKCLVCGAEYEPLAHRSLVCDICRERVRDNPGQTLTVQERLWGRCYENGGHWEYGSVRPDGRPNPIMIDRSQRPPAQVALFLNGQAPPSKDHVVRATCGVKLCVRPEHLEWAERVTGAALRWGHGLSSDDITEMLGAHREARAQYQRNYRKRLKTYGVRKMKDVDDGIIARAALEVAAAAGSDVLPESAAVARVLPNAKNMERTREVMRTARTGRGDSIAQRKAATLARWDAMTPDERTSALAQMPRATSGDAVQDARRLTTAGEALGVPADIAQATIIAERPPAPAPRIEDPAERILAKYEREAAAKALEAQRHTETAPATDTAPERSPEEIAEGSSGLAASIRGAKIAPAD